MEDGFYLVTIRRDKNIRPNAEQLEGNIYYFGYGWLIKDLDFYQGETAMIPLDDNFPKDAPTWIASGDLSPVVNPEAAEITDFRIIGKDGKPEEIENYLPEKRNKNKLRR